MDWNADAFFAQGKTHAVCQDYARAGFTPSGLPWAILSDGCSSSPHTDVGARLLVSAAASRMPWVTDNPFHNFAAPMQDVEILNAAANAANELDVDMLCLDATLFILHYETISGQPGVGVSLRGDGVLVTRRHDGSYEILIFEHENNAPRYLSYDLNRDRFDSYLNRFGEKGSRKHFDTRTGKWSEITEFEGHPSPLYVLAKECDLILAFSDGVQTFQRVVETDTSRSLESVPIEEVVEQILKIKGTKGQFLQRRCHKFLTKFCDVNRWQHADDFSAAAIWMSQ